jgi:5'-3' exoribonuclease 2
VGTKRERSGEEKEAEKTRVEEAYKARSQAILDQYKDQVQDEIRFWQAGWKDRYYADKYKEKDIKMGGGRERVFREYIRGLCWVMAYYYDDCASWKWYYPFHYAPFASDLRNIERYAPEFGSGGEEDEPFRPLEQLMAVLPKESHQALPKSCHDLMLKKDSPIADFYPEEVEIDPNGKAMPWLWVALLPFIDEERLLLHLGAASEEFDEDAKDRNRFRTATIFAHNDHGPLARVLSQQQQEHQAAAAKGTTTTPSSSSEVNLDCSSTGVGGVVNVPADSYGFACHVRSVGDVLTAPHLPLGRYEDIKDNRALALSYQNPAKTVHKSELLAGAVLSEPKLGPYDMTIRVPRLNRGMNIADLGGGGKGGKGGGGGNGKGGGKGFEGGGGKGNYGGGGRGGGGIMGRGPRPPFQSAPAHQFSQQQQQHQHQQPYQPQYQQSYQAEQQQHFAGHQAQHTRSFPQAFPSSFNQGQPPQYGAPGYPHGNDHHFKRQRHDGPVPFVSTLPPRMPPPSHAPPGISPPFQHLFQTQIPQQPHQPFSLGRGLVPPHPPPHSFGHPVPLDNLRAGLAQTLARRDPPGANFQHHRP